MANVNGTDINLMPTEGMRTEAQRYRNWKKKEKAVVQMTQEQELHKY